ncbi:uncharacterized protein LOC144167936 [Haemaphysalis longicornis]
MDARSFTFRSQRHYRPSPVYKLQELCRRVLIAHFTLTGWKSATQRLSGRGRREAALIPSGDFFGCSVNFFLQPKFSKSGHPSYQVKCLLDQTWYLAIRVQDRRPERILEDEEFWRWAWPVHRHLLSALAVAVDAPSSSVYIITVLPDDRLERVALELAASALCIAEANLWKFLLQLCSVLLYLEGQGLTVEPFDYCNVYLRGNDIVLNNRLVWTKRHFEATSLPACLWSLLLPPGEKCTTLHTLRTGSEASTNAFSVAAVLAQLVSLSLGGKDSLSPPGKRTALQPSGSSHSQVGRIHGVEVIYSPSHYSERLLATLGEMFRNSRIALQEVRDIANVCSGVRRMCRRECLGSGEPSFLIVLTTHVPGDGWHVEVAEQVPRERGSLRAVLRSLSLVPKPLVNAGVRPPVKPWPPQKQTPQPFCAGPTDSDDTFAASKSTKWQKENEISSEEATTTLSSAPEIPHRDRASRCSPGSPRGRRRRARIERQPEQEERSQSCLCSHGKTLLVAVMGLFIVGCITADVLDRKWTAAALMNASMLNGNGLVGSGLQNVSRQDTETVVRTFPTAARTTTRAPFSPPTPLTSVEGTLPRSSLKMAARAGQRGLGENKTAQFKVTDRCGPVRYTYCQRLRQEFFYDRESGACTDVASAAAQSAERDLAQHGAGGHGNAEKQLCNISPNRFRTLEACRRTCQDSKSPPKDCLEKTVFLKCRSDKARPALWYFDGHRCHSWNFGDDRCPEGDVFNTHQQCSMTCSSSRIRRNQGVMEA